MSEEASIRRDLSETTRRAGEFRRIHRVLMGRRVVVFGMIVILAFLLTAIFAPWIAPFDPYKQDMSQALLQPCREHLGGTDPLGRDTLSRLIFGTRVALMVSVVAIGAAATIGMTVGLFAGYFGGWVNAVIMSFIDSLMACPMILLALFIAGVLEGGLENVIIALSISLMPQYARLMCGQVLSVRENDYVLAARSIGTSNVRIMVQHILPNCLPPLIVQVTMMMGMAILAEAALSFLGIGIKPPGAAWGAMVSDGYQYLMTDPILSFAPGLAIMLVVFSFNMVGDGLRDALDPSLRGVL